MLAWTKLTVLNKDYNFLFICLNRNVDITFLTFFWVSWERFLTLYIMVDLDGLSLTVDIFIEIWINNCTQAINAFIYKYNINF